jgi:hypothetical protein
VKVRPPCALDEENREEILVVNFAMSSSALQSIQEALSTRGFTLGIDCVDCATFLMDAFKPRAARVLGRPLDPRLFTYARSANMTSNVPIETTVLGNWLLLEALRSTASVPGAVVEIGAYQCGNSCLLLNAMTLWGDARRYYVLDSFEGFGPLSERDPAERALDYACDYGKMHVFNRLRLFDQARVAPGFVPGSFAQLDHAERFSLVFVDCDLYQPTLDCCQWFWDRILPGGCSSFTTTSPPRGDGPGFARPHRSSSPLEA